MTANGLQTDIILGDEHQNEKLDLIDFTHRFFPCIESIEPTNKLQLQGKWFLVCRQQKLDLVHKYVDETLPDIYKRFAEKEDLFPGYPSPCRTPPQQGTKIRAPPKIVGTYASVLREYSSNPQEDDNPADNNDAYNRAPERPRKRQAVQLLFDNKEFPVIPGSTTPTQATQATPSTVTQVVNTQISDFDAKLNAIEHKMQLQINTIHETQTLQMQTLMNKFDSTVQTMMTSMNVMMENFGKSLIDSRNPHVSSEQALSHLIPLTQNPHGGFPNNTVPSPSNLPNTSLPLNQTQQSSVGVGALNK
jgi:hypothetical protein